MKNRADKSEERERGRLANMKKKKSSSLPADNLRSERLGSEYQLALEEEDEREARLGVLERSRRRRQI